MIYRKSSFGHRVISGGHRECPGTTGGARGVHRVGPPIPLGPLGRKGEVASPNGLAHHMGPPPHAPRVETLGGRGRHLALGGKNPPLAAAPPCRWDLQGRRTPWPPIYMWGGEGSHTQVSGASPPPVTPHTPSAGRRRSPAGFSTASTTTPSCCWISDDLSSPLAGSRRR